MRYYPDFKESFKRMAFNCFGEPDVEPVPHPPIPPAPPSAAEERPKWEYKSGWWRDDGVMSRWYGEDGWEVITVFQREPERDYMAFMKRRVS